MIAKMQRDYMELKASFDAVVIKYHHIKAQLKDLTQQQEHEMQTLMDEMTLSINAGTSIASKPNLSPKKYAASSITRRRRSLSSVVRGSSSTPSKTMSSSSTSIATITNNDDQYASKTQWQALRDEIIRIKRRNVDLARHIMDIAHKRDLMIDQYEHEKSMLNASISDLRTHLSRSMMLDESLLSIDSTNSSPDTSFRLTRQTPPSRKINHSAESSVGGRRRRSQSFLSTAAVRDQNRSPNASAIPIDRGDEGELSALVLDTTSYSIALPIDSSDNSFSLLDSSIEANNRQ